ncbi:hypothetical protein ABZP36_015207 [Zizania latifolia]
MAMASASGWLRRRRVRRRCGRTGACAARSATTEFLPARLAVKMAPMVRVAVAGAEVMSSLLRALGILGGNIGCPVLWRKVCFCSESSGSSAGSDPDTSSAAGEESEGSKASSLSFPPSYDPRTATWRAFS